MGTDLTFFDVVVVVFVFVPLTHFRSFRARSVGLNNILFGNRNTYTKINIVM